MDELPDETLLDMISAGSTPAWLHLYWRRAEYLRRRIREQLTDPDEVEKVLDRVFAEVWVRAPRLKRRYKDEPVLALYQIANKLIERSNGKDAALEGERSIMEDSPNRVLRRATLR